MKKPQVIMEMEQGGRIILELEGEIAPQTVDNFVALAQSGYYDGLTFHRVIPGFMIQGGCPQGTGTGNPGHTIPGEFAANGFENNLQHQRGVISMARSQHPDSAGSQFFITVAPAPHLDGHYAAFGRVTEGMETVDEIVGARRDPQDRPLEAQKIKKVTVQSFDGEEQGKK